MLDAGKNTAPVATIKSLVNNSVNFYINPIAAKDPVVDSTQQIEKPALLAHGGLAGGILAISPCFGFVVRHARSLIQRLRRLHQKSMQSAQSIFV